MSSPLAAGAWWAAANVGTPTSMAPITAPTRPAGEDQGAHAGGTQ